jgi:hypothetical protein
MRRNGYAFVGLSVAPMFEPRDMEPSERSEAAERAVGRWSECSESGEPAGQRMS